MVVHKATGKTVPIHERNRTFEIEMKLERAPFPRLGKGLQDQRRGGRPTSINWNRGLVLDSSKRRERKGAGVKSTRTPNELTEREVLDLWRLARAQLSPVPHVCNGKEDPSDRHVTSDRSEEASARVGLEW